MGIFKQKPQTEREKVEERRDEVLARGRKFKYPMQYAKHKLVINTIIIAFVAIALMFGIGALMLYRWQDTGDTIYRVTEILPVPVAKVAGKPVRYSDYLMIYRSNLMTAEQQGGQLGSSTDDELVRQGYKKSALASAIEYTYALKLAEERGISVTDAEIDAEFAKHQNVGGVDRSEEGFLKILQTNFGMNKSEYRRMLYLSLMKAKVSEAVDSTALSLASQADTLLASNGGDLLATAQALGDTVQYEETGHLVNNMNVDGGRSMKAMTLEAGTISPRFLSSNGDAFYYVKLIAKTDSEVNYSSLRIGFSTFSDMVAELYQTGQVTEYITIDLPGENTND